LFVEPVPQEKKQENILSFFGTQELPNFEKKEKKKIIHSASTDQVFNRWRPGDMAVEPAKTELFAWAFIETFERHLPVKEEELVVVEARPELLPAVPPGPDKILETEKIIEEMLNKARAQADEIILDAQASAENAVLQAQEEIDQQKQVGYQAGLSEVQFEFETALKASRGLIDEVHEWQKALMVQGEQILVEMVKDIAQTMFGEGVKLDATALQINLNRVMESAQGLGDLNIFINPRDTRLLDPSWSEYQLLVSGDRVKIIPSENILPGGCFVKGSMGTVDARVETQLAAVLATFEEHKNDNG
jgi:flagellar biosynthesis/type III secretory pathway protein FliH